MDNLDSSSMTSCEEENNNNFALAPLGDGDNATHPREEREKKIGDGDGDGDNAPHPRDREEREKRKALDGDYPSSVAKKQAIGHVSCKWSDDESTSTSHLLKRRFKTEYQCLKPILPCGSIISSSASASQSATAEDAGSPFGLTPTSAFPIPTPTCKWKRVLLKVSGAALAAAGTAPHNVNSKVVMQIAREIQAATRRGVQVAIAVEGGNILCGKSWIAATAVDKDATYQICLMASVMNAMLLQASLEKIGVATRVQSNLTMQEVAEPYIRRKAISHLDKGRVVIFGGIAFGHSNPNLTFDAAAAQRASEIHADAVVKGTIPGRSSSSSPGFEHISYKEFIFIGDHTAMDTTAVTLCEENKIPVVMFNLLEPGNISKAIAGDQIGTLIDKIGRFG